MQKETSGSINKILAAVLIGVMLILMIGIVASGWQTDNNGQNSGKDGDSAANTDNLNGDTDENSGTADNFIDNENTTQKAPEHIDYLTGLETQEKYENRIPFAMVMESNAPSYGISNSSLTVEIPIEKANTRLINYKTDILGLGKLGAFADSRDYISQLTAFFGGLIISNGKDDIIPYSSLSSTVAFDLSKHKDAVYKENGNNLYTEGEKIIKISKDEGIDLITYKRPDLPFVFCDFNESVSGNTSAKKVRVPYSEQNVTELIYDTSSERYTLYKNERAKIDMLNGEAITYKNVFVLFSDVVTYETASGTQSIVKTATGGSGYYISNGTLTEIKWSVDSANNLIFKNLNGSKLIINRGNSFIGYYKASDSNSVTFQ